MQTLININFSLQDMIRFYDISKPLLYVPDDDDDIDTSANVNDSHNDN